MVYEISKELLSAVDEEDEVQDPCCKHGAHNLSQRERLHLAQWLPRDNLSKLL